MPRRAPAQPRPAAAAPPCPDARRDRSDRLRRTPKQRTPGAHRRPGPSPAAPQARQRRHRGIAPRPSTTPATGTPRRRATDPAPRPRRARTTRRWPSRRRNETRPGSRAPPRKSRRRLARQRTPAEHHQRHRAQVLAVRGIDGRPAIAPRRAREHHPVVRHPVPRDLRLIHSRPRRTERHLVGEIRAAPQPRQANPIDQRLQVADGLCGKINVAMVSEVRRHGPIVAARAGHDSREESHGRTPV